jgi:hypothetical protein
MRRKMNNTHHSDPDLKMKHRSTRTEVDSREILGAEKSAPKLGPKIKNNCFGYSTARSQIK